MALTGLAIAAALSLAKSKMIDEPQANRQRKLAAETQRYSPWTKLQAKAPQDPNAIGQLIQYGATGAAMGASLKKGATPKDMSDVANAYGATGAANTPPQDSGLYGNAPSWTNTNSPWPYRGAPEDSMEYSNWRKAQAQVP